MPARGYPDRRRHRVNFNVDDYYIHSGDGGHGALSPVPEGLRKDLKGGWTMIYLTVGLVAFLFVYLFLALIRPEWF